MTATLPNSYLASAGTVTISVYSPGPGGGTSAGATLTVTGAQTPILSVIPASPPTQPATAGTITFNVSNTGGGTMSYSASVTSGSSWLHISSGGAGGNSGTIVVSYDQNTGAQRQGTIQVTASGASGSPATVTISQAVGSGGAPVELSGTPYINQVYDTADDFVNGNHCCGYHACNATAALMAIQYYRKLPANPITCTRGGSHTSLYGSYISRTYLFNGHNYNIPSSTVWDTPGSSDAGFYGGFGYFLQDLADDPSQRSTRLSEYIAYHGLASSVDEAVSGNTGYTKICAEIDAGHPVVVLVTIPVGTGTETWGHYITCIGYVRGQHTLIFNDPYGNYATYRSTFSPNANGTRVFYDLPDGNNGYPKLGQIDRIIYARGTIQIYTVTPSLGANGNINPSTPQTVPLLGGVSFTASPATGSAPPKSPAPKDETTYIVDQWLVNGIPAQTGGTDFTLLNVTADTAVQVTFKPAPVVLYTVTPSAAVNGSISPSLAQSVASGDSITFTGLPNPGYAVDQWQTNNVAAQSGGTSFTLAKVTADTAVQVTFAAAPTATDTVTVSPVPAYGGTVSGEGAFTDGSQQTVTATATPGYSFINWTENGIEVHADDEPRVSGELHSHAIHLIGQGCSGAANHAAVFRWCLCDDDQCDYVGGNGIGPGPRRQRNLHCYGQWR